MPVNRIKLDEPLERQEPEIFGDFDKEQELLLNSSNVQSNIENLFMIENASEIARRLLNDEEPFANKNNDTLKKILEVIMYNSEDYIQMPIYTFEEVKTTYQDVSIVSDEDISNFIKNLPLPVEELKQHYFAGIMGLQLASSDSEDPGQHYCAYMYHPENKKLEMFDSMSDYFQNTSDLSKLFLDILSEIFDTEATPLPCLREDYFLSSLQATGGFARGDPMEVLYAKYKKKTKKNYSDPTKKMTYDNNPEYYLTTPESQNHFCYMWSILYIHFRLKGYNILTIRDLILDTNIDPIVFIKSYIYGIIYSKDLNLYKRLGKYREFFDHWFKYVYTRRNLYNLSSIERYDMKKYKSYTQLIDLPEKGLTIKEVFDKINHPKLKDFPNLKAKYGDFRGYEVLEK